MFRHLQCPSQLYKTKFNQQCQSYFCCCCFFLFLLPYIQKIIKSYFEFKFICTCFGIFSALLNFTKPNSINNANPILYHLYTKISYYIKLYYITLVDVHHSLLWEIHLQYTYTHSYSNQSPLLPFHTLSFSYHLLPHYIFFTQCTHIYTINKNLYYLIDTMYSHLHY